MRKASHDGGDSTSITSGFENETRKTSVGIIKTKRNSIKRKVQNFSHESDDTVIEPLLQIDKTETINRSAKYLLSKSKTDSLNEREGNMHSDSKFEKYSASKPICSTGTTSNSNITIHNHMNTNVFGYHDGAKVISTIKSPVLVEINGGRAPGNTNQNSSIFTTAKIHADSITKTISPIQVTPLPILSTVEGSILKAGVSSCYSQSKNVDPSTSNSSKPINYFNRSVAGKSDVGNEPILKNIATVLDSRSLVTSTISDSNLLNKSCNTQNATVTSLSKIGDTEIGNKVTQQPQSSINTTSEKKGNTSQEQCLGIVDKFRLKDSETKIEILDSVSSQNQNKSSLQTNVSKDFDISKKEDKITSSSGKQLQRQKNTIVEDTRDVDIHVKNVSEINKFYASVCTTTTDALAKGELNIIPDAVTKQSNVPSTTKRKDNGIQLTVLKSDSVTTNEMAMTSSSISTAGINKTPIVSNTCKEFSPKPSIQSKVTDSLLLKSDFTNEKKRSESQINKAKTDCVSTSAGSAKELILKSTVSVQPSHSIKLLGLDSAKDFKASSSANSKSVMDNSSLYEETDKKIIPKPAVTTQPKQETTALRSNSLTKENAIGNLRAIKSDTANTTVGSTILKDDTARSTAIVQPSHPLTKIQSSLAKENKQETNNFLKEVDCKSSTIGAVKSPITTNYTGSKKVNVTKCLETTPVPKSVTSTAHIISSDKMDVKIISVTQPHIFTKSQTTSNPLPVKTITSNSSPLTITTASAISKPSTSTPSYTNTVLVSSKAELSNKTLSSASSVSSTKSVTTTLAKSSSSTSQSSKAKAIDKHGKI